MPLRQIKIKKAQLAFLICCLFFSCSAFPQATIKNFHFRSIKKNNIAFEVFAEVAIKSKEEITASQAHVVIHNLDGQISIRSSEATYSLLSKKIFFKNKVLLEDSHKLSIKCDELVYDSSNKKAFIPASFYLSSPKEHPKAGALIATGQKLEVDLSSKKIKASNVELQQNHNKSKSTIKAKFLSGNYENSQYDLNSAAKISAEWGSIAAEKIKIKKNKDLYFLEAIKKVSFTKEDAKVRSQHATLKPKNSKDFLARFTGNVAFNKDSFQGQADELLYNTLTQLINLRGNASLKNEQQEISGKEIDLSLKDQSLTVRNASGSIKTPKDL